MTQSSHKSEAENLVELEALGEQRFRAHFIHDNTTGALFGGQALGQALAAAQRTKPGWRASNLHGTFLRSGRTDCPIDFEVESVMDSRRFAHRRVQAIQGDKVIFILTCSFHAGEEGLRHEFAEMGTPPAPETLMNLRQLAESGALPLSENQLRFFTGPSLIEMCLEDPVQYHRGKDDPKRNYWFRIPSAGAIASPHDHSALLALMSDFWFPGTIAACHGRKGRECFLVSLNHVMWFHRDVRVDQWLYYQTESDWADHGRGLVHGKIFNRQGEVVASTSQEALLRPL